MITSTLKYCQDGCDASPVPFSQSRICLAVNLHFYHNFSFTLLECDQDSNNALQFLMAVSVVAKTSA